MNHDRYAGDYPWWRYEPAWDHVGRDEPAELDRLTHLVLVDGRLVETWSEPVTGTR
jgi:hypothetical protein